MNNPPKNGKVSLPWTPEQFQQMKTMLNVTIPEHEDNLNRAEKSGLDVSEARKQLAIQKDSLFKMIDAWKDKY